MGRYVEAGRANTELSNERRSGGSIYNAMVRGQDAERGASLTMFHPCLPLFLSVEMTSSPFRVQRNVDERL